MLYTVFSTRFHGWYSQYTVQVSVFLLYLFTSHAQNQIAHMKDWDKTEVTETNKSNRIQFILNDENQMIYSRSKITYAFVAIFFAPFSLCTIDQNCKKNNNILYYQSILIHLFSFTAIEWMKNSNKNKKRWKTRNMCTWLLFGIDHGHLVIHTTFSNMRISLLCSKLAVWIQKK